MAYSGHGVVHLSHRCLIYIGRRISGRWRDRNTAYFHRARVTHASTRAEPGDFTVLATLQACLYLELIFTFTAHDGGIKGINFVEVFHADQLFDFDSVRWKCFETRSSASTGRSTSTSTGKARSNARAGAGTGAARSRIPHLAMEFVYRTVVHLSTEPTGGTIGLGSRPGACACALATVTHQRD